MAGAAEDGYDRQLEGRGKAGWQGYSKNWSWHPTLQTWSNCSPTLGMIPGQKCETVQVWRLTVYCNREFNDTQGSGGLMGNPEDKRGSRDT